MRSRKTFNLLFAILIFSCGNDDSLNGLKGKQTQIESVEPMSGAIGEIVVIEGKGFGDMMEENRVKFNGHTASIITASITRLVVTVPNGAESGPVTVKVGGKTAKSNTDFVVKP
ncbi:IPT/TIG domain-containing protein [Flagellimonas flava]|uniref:IPT/TIG domain-containing protein n=1 Tax=Flagellimonas flava TaxID=570519 RepID=UPI003D6531EF